MAVAINDLEERGRQFRFAIDENFQRQKRERSLKPFPFINNMRYFIVTYIAVERSFDEAETILITAGFNAHMRPASNIVGTREDKYDVIATLLLARGFPSITLLVVAMHPIRRRLYRCQPSVRRYHCQVSVRRIRLAAEAHAA